MSKDQKAKKAIAQKKLDTKRAEEMARWNRRKRIAVATFWSDFKPGV